jgi:hypothetical protein
LARAVRRHDSGGSHIRTMQVSTDIATSTASWQARATSRIRTSRRQSSTASTPTRGSSATKAKPFPNCKQQKSSLLSTLPPSRTGFSTYFYQAQPGVVQPCCPWPPAGPRGARSPQRGPHQRKARGGAQTRQARRQLRGSGVYLVTFRARDEGRARCLCRVGICTSSSPSNCVTRVCRRTLLVASSTRTSHFSFLRGTIAQVSTALDAAQRAIEQVVQSRP